MIDRVELAKALRATYMGAGALPKWDDLHPLDQGSWLRTADKALELLAPKPAPEATDREIDRLVEALRGFRVRDYDNLGEWHQLAERLRKIVLEEIGDTQTAALRSRVSQLEREAGCYQEEIAGLRKAAADRSDLASEVTELRARLASESARAERYRSLFLRELAIATDLAEVAK